MPGPPGDGRRKYDKNIDYISKLWYIVAYIMKKFLIILSFLNAFSVFVYSQNNTEIYFGSNIGIDYGLQDINITYKTALEEASNSSLLIERFPHFSFSLYAGYYGYAENIAIQTGVDFYLNEKFNQNIKGNTEYSHLLYSYINVPLLLRLSKKIINPVQVGLLIGPYISFPLGKIEERTLTGTNNYAQETTVGVEFDQFITYSLKKGRIIFLINYKRDFSEKFISSGVGIFTQQNIKIVLGYEYNFNI
jgi:hypothetical protein